MRSEQPVRVAVAGLGGYAHQIIQLIREQGPTTTPAVALVAACDPAMEDHAEWADELRASGVDIYPDYHEMLAAGGFDAVWLPVPIDLHVPFTEAALAAGKAVMVEKPVAGTIDEVDQMIAARDRAGGKVLVGFQDVYDPTILTLKRRLLGGEFGRVSHASVRACWPRDSAYFQRAAWAGKTKRGDSWVLDSPVNNAVAHFVNLVLYLLGETEADSATPTHLAAELYRAASIENYDTASLRLTLPGDVEFIVLLTHACEQRVGPIIEIHAERGHVEWEWDGMVIRPGPPEGDTPPEPTVPRDKNLRRHILRGFAAYVAGVDTPDLGVATLEVARAHAVVVSAASQATAVTAVPDAAIRSIQTDTGTIAAIPDIEAIFDRCAAQRQTLHESGRLDFTRPPGILDLAGYNHFAGLAAGEPRG